MGRRGCASVCAPDLSIAFCDLSDTVDAGLCSRVTVPEDQRRSGHVVDWVSASSQSLLFLPLFSDFVTLRFSMLSSALFSSEYSH